MIDYRQLGLFDDIVEDESDADIVDNYRDYILVQDPEQNKDGTFNYKIFDDFGVLVKTLKASTDVQSISTNQYKDSNIRNAFVSFVNSEHMNKALARSEAENKKRRKSNNSRRETQKTTVTIPSKAKNTYVYDYDDDYFYRNYDPKTGNYRSFVNYSFDEYPRYQPKPKSTGFLDKLNKSDTLVVHCEDRSTDMLSQVYDGKGWDVLRDGNIDKSELHELLKNHDRVVFLGHGTSGGLINVQGGGSVIGAEEAPLLKDKLIFAIWCNADKYFSHHGIGNGFFITKNAPSEVWECRAAGCGNISAELMLENITYWSKLCADVVEEALGGNGRDAVNYVRKNYLEQYGNHPVTIYNADSASLLGINIPLPKYEFKGEPLQPKDYPYQGYNEEEFLKNPVMRV